MEETRAKLDKLNIDCEIIGNGSTVIEQTPSPGYVLDPEHGKIILYTSAIENDSVEVPKFEGMSVFDANITASRLGISLAFLTNYTYSGDSMVLSQSVPAGTVVKKGSVIKLTAVYTDFED